MENQQSTATPPAPTTHDTPSGGTISQVFLNADGLRAGWRLLIYVAIVAALFLGLKTISMQLWMYTLGVFS